jgi:hypothetical protein
LDSPEDVGEVEVAGVGGAGHSTARVARRGGGDGSVG